MRFSSLDGIMHFKVLKYLEYINFTLSGDSELTDETKWSTMGNCWSRRTRHPKRGSSGSLVVNIPLAQLSQSSGNPSVDQPPPVPPRTSSRGQHQQSIRNVPADQPSPPPCDASKVQPPQSPPGTPSGGHQHQPTRSLGACNRQIKEHRQIVYPVHNFEGGKSVKPKKIL